MSTTDIIFLDGQPRIVTERCDITIQLDREVNGKMSYDETGYVAVRTRPATVEEIQQWRAANA